MEEGCCTQPYPCICKEAVSGFEPMTNKSPKHNFTAAPGLTLKEWEEIIKKMINGGCRHNLQTQLKKNIMKEGTHQKFKKKYFASKKKKNKYLIETNWYEWRCRCIKFNGKIKGTLNCFLFLFTFNFVSINFFFKYNFINLIDPLTFVI